MGLAIILCEFKDMTGCYCVPLSDCRAAFWLGFRGPKKLYKQFNTRPMLSISNTIETYSSPLNPCRWAYAKLGFHPGALLEGFSTKICQPATLEGMTAQACTNCLWGFAVFQGCSLPAFEVLVSSLIRSHAWSALEQVQQHQLFQVSKRIHPSI